MFLRLLFDGFIKPFRLTFLTLVSFAIPSALVSPFSWLLSVGLPRLVIGVSPVPPALSPIETLASWLRFTRVVVSCPGRIRPIPVVHAVSAWSLAIVSIFVLSKVTEVAARPVDILTIILVSYSTISAVAIWAVTHASMETFSTLLAKALARLHSTPTIAILICFTTTTEVASPVPISITESIISVSFAIPVAKSKAISSIAIFELLVAIERLLRSRVCR